MSRSPRLTCAAAMALAALALSLGACGRFGYEYLTGDGGTGTDIDAPTGTGTDAATGIDAAAGTDGGKATDTDAAPGTIDAGPAADAGTTVSADAGVPAVCVQANGLTWCYDPNACGQPCNNVCAARGLTPVADDVAWFQAQNTAAKCQAISDAFGITTPIVIMNYRYACLEDESGAHTVGGGLLAPLYCSTVSSCPSKLRNTLDQHNACGASSTRAICPCQ